MVLETEKLLVKDIKVKMLVQAAVFVLVSKVAKLQFIVVFQNVDLQIQKKLSTKLLTLKISQLDSKTAQLFALNV